MNDKIDAAVEKLNTFIGRSLKCPMCGCMRFEVCDGFFTNEVKREDEMYSLTKSGVTIPTLPIVCLDCGFVSQHSIGVLGLLKKNSDK